MTAFDTQKGFFDTIKSSQKIEDSSIAIYQELVYLRFEDVIKSSLPMYCTSKNDDEICLDIKDFILYGAKSRYVWQIPLEFALFLRNTKKTLCKNDIDLLDFEIIQLKLYVSNHPFRSSKFSWNKRYLVSKNAKMISTKVDVFGENDLKRKYILIYKDDITYDVFYIKITKIIYLFFKFCRSFHTANNALALAIKNENLDTNEVKSVIKTTLNNFCKKGILS